MGGACGLYGENRNVYIVSVGKPEEDLSVNVKITIK